MNELKCLLRAAEELRSREEAFIVATVVRVLGSSYRRPGARMLVTRDRWIAGSVSGGCLEGDVLKKGWWRTSDGAPTVVTYDTRADGDGVGLGLGCDGIVEVLLERERARELDPFAFVRHCFDRQEPGALATVFAGTCPIGSRAVLFADGSSQSDVEDEPLRDAITSACRAVLESGRTTVVSFASASGSSDVLVEAVRPPPALFVFGTGHDAVPVVTIARSIGWDAHVCEPYARFATRERFVSADAVLSGSPGELAARVDGCDRAMAVVMSHDYERDRAMLAALLQTRAAYIGMLGPRRRTRRMLDELGIRDEHPRLHAPVGLALGAESPQEIALAIVAEAQSVLARTDATSLREHQGTIHGTSDAAAE